ncbi:hypothetical protein DICPUDRAFT_158041 [Dictyostelium purpureum]|uniref:Uncharacterized protein n=1 Tax=Dictyostelium purpureum TaxID=5786 RepID=F1A0N8_DICPU|nr:uncharacterized protein DICPUDRAFT_158041 [Dictyostelium purpureum]EGC30238.1 hypothetical protein DICPUDRAFT_158041 [Dictyostelium purpureum]|eukprot:XP_003293230.1 hypothetical protein DICPUDRAFT_158041 [Dictyostelium purpureum]
MKIGMKQVKDSNSEFNDIINPNFNDNTSNNNISMNSNNSNNPNRIQYNIETIDTGNELIYSPENFSPAVRYNILYFMSIKSV